MKKYFDLNIEKVLEHWTVSFAIREFISNAIDEQRLTNTKSIDVYKDDGIWVIRDYGRGIQSKHFSQNENEEKLKSKKLIGKFGVGLKDALAVLSRHNKKVEIISKYSNVHTEMKAKDNFELETLHAVFGEIIDSNFIGTEIKIYDISDSDMEEAKSFFLYFQSESPLEITRYGEIYSTNSIPSIYVNGLQIAQEENFLFSYNITNINAKLKKALNRERSNVGRTAYSDSVKNILLRSKTEYVLDHLVKDLQNYTRGTQKDESTWTDIAVYAAKTLNETDKYMFVSASSPLDTNQAEVTRSTRREIVTLPDSIYQRLKLGGDIYTYENAVKEYNDSFEFDEIAYEKLTNKEKEVYDYVDKIRTFFKNNTFLKLLPKVTVVKSLGLTVKAYGLWDGKQIWIDRKTLSKERKFIEVVSHEFAHSLNDNVDNTRAFENDLGEVFSYYAYFLLKNIK